MEKGTYNVVNASDLDVFLRSLKYSRSNIVTQHKDHVFIDVTEIMPKGNEQIPIKGIKTTGINHLGDDPHNFTIKGECYADLERSGVPEHYIFEFNYSTKNRKGVRSIFGTIAFYNEE